LGRLDEESAEMTSPSRRPGARYNAARPASVILLLALALLQPWTACAHVGSPDVFFDGQIGPYPAHITIRMPSVVPGQAQIEVRPKTDKPLTVSFLPLYSKTSIKNAPPPEMAHPVASEPGLYQGDLWLMSVGAYSIEVRLSGASGEGAARIPVNSVATHQLPLSPFLANLLLGLGGLLVVGMLGIVYAAAGESVLAPGAPMRKPERVRGLVASFIAAVILALLLVGGWNWWKADEREFRRNLREGAWPDLTAAVETEGRQRVLHLTLGEAAFKPDYSLPLLRDHGKLLHLFLIREPAHDVFAHLHPVRRGGKTFDLALPNLPEGNYKVLCDFTLSDSGLSSTASGSVHIPPIPAAAAATAIDAISRVAGLTVHVPPIPAAATATVDGISLHPDPDDSWSETSPHSVSPTTAEETSFALPGGRLALWKAHSPLRAKHDAHLEFTFRDSAGQPLPLEPYMGMMSHAAILRADDKVFAHLHPTGNFSMAAESFFAAKIAREASQSPDTEPPMEMDHSKMHHASNGPGASSIVLPYEFPLPGNYRVWVQIKTGGQVLTATFDAAVAP
jgi:hypothetical protein